MNGLTFGTKYARAVAVALRLREFNDSIEDRAEPAYSLSELPREPWNCTSTPLLPECNLEDSMEPSSVDERGWSQFVWNVALAFEDSILFRFPVVVNKFVLSCKSLTRYVTLPLYKAKDNKEPEAEFVFSPTTELRYINRSTSLSFTDTNAMFLDELGMAVILQGREYPDYCICNEDSCFDSPPCCADGLCPPNGFSQFGAALGLQVPSAFRLLVVISNAISSSLGALASTPAPMAKSSFFGLGAVFEGQLDTGTLEGGQSGRSENLYCYTESGPAKSQVAACCFDEGRDVDSTCLFGTNPGQDVAQNLRALTNVFAGLL